MALKAGWEAGPGGGNMVKNTASGQVLDINHPLYAQAAEGPAQPAAPGATGAAPAGPQTTGQAITGPSTVGAQPAQGSQTSVAGAFQQALLNNLAPPPVTEQSSQIAPAIQANSLAQQRGQERQRAQMAESAAASGTNNSGGFNAALLGLDQARAQQEGQFNADAIQGQTDKNRQAQLTMAALAGGLLQGNDAQALQKYGIDTGAATANKGIDTQASLGQGDLALRDKLGSGGLSLGLLQALMGNDQFSKGLSSNNAQFGASLNQQALLKAMGL